MDQGFQAYNDAGVLQVETNTFNLALQQKSTGSFTNLTFGSATVRYCTFTVTGLRNPILAVSVPGNLDFWSGCKNNGGGSFTFYVYSVGATAGSTFTYYIFDSTDIVAPTDNFGLQVFNAAGSQVYHSSAKVMRAAAFITSYATTTLTSGRTYAVATASMERQFTSTFLDIATYSNVSQYSSSQINGNVITTLQEVYESYITTTAQANTDYGAPAFLVLDVTNY